MHELGFRPQRPSEEGIASTVDWLRAHPHKESRLLWRRLSAEQEP